jgi:mannose-1-phosphate guanylyltransferase
MNTHHRAEAFQHALPPDVVVVHEPAILGTAGGVCNAASLLGAGEVLVWNGDVLAEPDLGALLRAHTQGGCGATLLAVPRPAGQGTLGLSRASQVVRLRGETFGAEHAGADFIGIQVLSPGWRARLPSQGCLVGELYLPALREGLPIQVSIHPGAWDDIGTPQALLQANLRWLARNQLASWSAGEVPPGVRLDSTVLCEGGAAAGDGVLHQCLVLPGATLRAPASRVIAMSDGRVIPAG